MSTGNDCGRIDYWLLNQWLLNNRASDCWTIVQVNIEQLYQWLRNNCSCDYWIIVTMIVPQSCQQLLNNCNCVSGCRKVKEAVKELCPWFLNNCVSDCWEITLAIVKSWFNKPFDCGITFIVNCCTIVPTNRSTGFSLDPIFPFIFDLVQYLPGLSRILILLHNY